MGPFIIHEFCENENLRDYLLSMKGNVTIPLQENLFRFGRDVAKGMEYLASKKVCLPVKVFMITFINTLLEKNVR